MKQTVVDLSSQDALNNARSFLEQSGYTPVERTDTSLTAKRQLQEQDAEQNELTVEVLALPQPGGGVRINVHGNDREGMREHKAEWAVCSENLPKRPEAQGGGQSDQEQGIQDSEGTSPRIRNILANRLPALSKGWWYAPSGGRKTTIVALAFAHVSREQFPCCFAR